MRAFLICPVRGHDPEETLATLEGLEREGWIVHWPHRDTNQNDPVGLAICKQNRQATEKADRIFVVWNGKSTGSLFDLGMAFALGKPLTIIDIPPETPHKSFQNMMRAWEKATDA